MFYKSSELFDLEENVSEKEELVNEVYAQSSQSDDMDQERSKYF